MTIKVLVVDDSSFFRRQISKILTQDNQIEVIDVAVDGREAIDKAIALKPDVITMDVEMPVLDGISAVKAIMAKAPTAILMFSSVTVEGARATLDAIEAGAVDYLPKRFEDIARDKEQVAKILCDRVKAVGSKGAHAFSQLVKTTPNVVTPKKAPAPKATSAPVEAVKPKAHYEVLAIGTSTGGPVALQLLLTGLPANFPLPIVIVQHMPGSFTPAFAQRLDQACDITVRHAEEGDHLKPGVAYLAPGGKQMRIKRGIIHIEESQAGQTYKPSVDITFDDLAENYGGNVLAVILTGMGHDGCEASIKLKNKGATIWAQDEATSVVYGMPAAVAEAGIVEKILPIGDISQTILSKV
ncbi:MAG: chemotaxis response regulator protein-glutamate methylesterase [Gammaproteobacteria bacterium]|nr:chemotaxis response regulator protein-glutamate methylesterase [Gammaproteobacteria bacterium]MDH5730189.1 chemotaxis response regulator protein-glutamate methylesterase [Gammaproteobacteria bacterium]